MRVFPLGLAAAFVAQAAARTNVAVLEVGEGGVVRRTTTSSPKATVNGVSSFWSSVHDVVNGKQRRRMQHSGMTLVPDLFNRADGGIVVGIIGNGVDIAAMPNVASIVEGTSNDVVGHFHLSGQKGEELIQRSSGEFVEDLGASLSAKVKELSTEDSANSLESFAVRVDNDASATEADAALGRTLKSVQKYAAETGSTVVIHLVVEEEEGAARRRLTSRNLNEGEGGDGEGEKDNHGEENKDKEENKNEEGDKDQNKDEEVDCKDEDCNNKNHAYYKVGYYDSLGVWHSGYKTMYQIQYFNTTLWTAIGLFVILYYSTLKMVNMPLMPDTLLFGESAKMMGE